MANVSPLAEIEAGIEDTEVTIEGLNQEKKKFNDRTLPAVRKANADKLSEANMNLATLTSALKDPGTRIRAFQTRINQLSAVKANLMASGVDPQVLSFLDAGIANRRNDINTELGIAKIAAAGSKSGQKFDRIKVWNTKTLEERSITVPKDTDFVPRESLGPEWELGEKPKTEKDRQASAAWKKAGISVLDRLQDIETAKLALDMKDKGLANRMLEERFGNDPAKLATMKEIIGKKDKTAVHEEFNKQRRTLEATLKRNWKTMWKDYKGIKDEEEKADKGLSGVNFEELDKALGL
jgi:hypothetical protein